MQCHLPRRVRIFLFALVQLAATGAALAAGDAPPAWTASAAHPDYRPPRYLLGVGLAKASGDLAKDRKVADQAAFAEVVQQITVSVSSSSSAERTVFKAGSDDSPSESATERASSGTSVRASMTVDGMSIVDRYFDPREKVLYSLAVLDREVAAAASLQTLQRSLADWRNHWSAASAQRAQGKAHPAMLSLRDAYLAAARYQEILPTYRQLAGAAGAASLIAADAAEPSPALAIDQLSAILGSLRIAAVKGDQQTYVGNRGPAEPLVVRVGTGEREADGAEGFLVEFRFRAGQGNLYPATARSDRRGGAQTVVSRIDPRPGEPTVVTARLDLQELLASGRHQGAWNDRFQHGFNPAEFSLKEKQAASTRIAIVVLDKGGDAAAVANLRSSLAARLAEKGFVLPAIERPVQSAAALSAARLRSQFAGKVDVVVVADLTEAPAEQAMGMNVCRLQGAVNAFDAASGKTLATLAVDGTRGFGNSVPAARSDAYRKAGGELAESLGTALLNQGN